ncbi:benenodin family lasso peptide [Sphingomonas oryzagri]
MDRIEDRDDEIIELGIASIETKGVPAAPLNDSIGTHQVGGISND